MMKFAGKIPNLLLIVALAITTLGTGAWGHVDYVSDFSSDDHASALPASPGPYHAACHEHGASFPELPRSDSRRSHSPQRAPVGYQCCLTGHITGLVQPSCFQQLTIQRAHAALQAEPALTSFLLSPLEVTPVLTADPPGTTPLRI